MATSYKVSPFSSPSLQTFIVQGVEVDQTGRINATGKSGTINAIHVSGGSGVNYVLIWDGVTATTQEADIVFATDNADDLTVYIDKGITCSTAVTFAVSSVAQGGSAPSGNVNVNLFVT
jgi:hypothetical protein